MQSLRDNPETAKQEYLFDTDEDRKGLSPKISYKVPKKNNIFIYKAFSGNTQGARRKWSK